MRALGLLGSSPINKIPFLRFVQVANLHLGNEAGAQGLLIPWKRDTSPAHGACH